jgi:hypothetical protein
VIEVVPVFGNKVSLGGGTLISGASIWSQCEEDDYLMNFPDVYHSTSISEVLREEIITHDDKIQRFYQSGKREVVFPNNVRRVVWNDGYSVIYFANNDIK